MSSSSRSARLALLLVTAVGLATAVPAQPLRLNAITPSSRPIANRVVPVVWVIGQSNACGSSLGYWLNNPFTAGVHRRLAYQAKVRIWWPGGSVSRPQSAPAWEAYQTGSNAMVNNSSYWITENRFGTEASLADGVQSHFGEAWIYKFAMVSRLDPRSTPTFSRGPTERDGLYGTMMQNWRVAEAHLRAQGLSPSIKGIIWIQGEGDTRAIGNPDLLLYARDYAQNLTRFIADLRNDLAPGRPPIPFVISQLHDQHEPRINWASGEVLVRAAQAQVAAQDPWAALCPVDNITLNPAGGFVHFDDQGYVDLGYRLFQTLQPMLR